MAKTIVCMWLPIKSEAILRAGVMALWRMPSSRFTMGGLYSTKVLAAAGAPLLSSSATGRSSIFSACSRGLATVAEQQMNTGLAP